MPRHRIVPETRPFNHTGNIVLIFLLTLAGCTGDVLGLGGPEGQWAGPVTPVAAECGAPTTGLMSVGRRTFAFDPFGGTAVIHGNLDKTGQLRGAAVSTVAGHDTARMEFVARLQRQSDNKEQILGTINSARCRWSVALRRD